jgi:phosphatidylinositol glycan class V
MEDKALREECSKSLPNLYNFVQKKFWSVGFLSYWKFSNSLFIMLGLPAILLGLGSFKGTIKDLKGSLDRNETKKEDLIKYGLELSFVILTLITVFLTNIQSSTRFFSSHVFFYMILGRDAKSKWLELWIWTYLILGGILFCIGFPWT